MKPETWLAIGGAAALATVAAVLISKRGASVAPPSAPLPSPPSPTYGETLKVSLSVPSGWRRVTSAEVTPELQSQASALMNTSGFTSMQYGTLSPFVASNGQTYATWIEQHYHPPGGATRPWGLHHGVTLLAAAGQA